MVSTPVREGAFIATGPVPEVLPYFAAADAGLNPITRGSGSNVKLFEYLAARLPVISTLFGVRGTNLVPDADFSSDVLNSAVAAILARVAPLVARTPGLTVEVDGYTDLGGEERESFAVQRAERVREALVRQGLGGSIVTARGMGTSHPLGSNATTAGREQNRRVEIVVSPKKA